MLKMLNLRKMYISPLEKCNLNCRICYTNKTDHILREDDILEFIGKFRRKYPLDIVTFCGGEVFLLSFFPVLVNKLTKKGILIEAVTNGTVDRLTEFTDPNAVNLIVSLDGLPRYHDKNRGKGNFAKSLAFLKKARKMGFHTEVFSIVTRQNLRMIDEFEDFLHNETGEDISVTYHPRKPPSYLLNHPVSNRFGETDGFSFLSDRETANLSKTKKTFPPKNLGCYCISLFSDKKVYGCCEGITPLGGIGDPVESVINNLIKRLSDQTLCCEPDFLCGMKKFHLKRYKNMAI